MYVGVWHVLLDCFFQATCLLKVIVFANCSYNLVLKWSWGKKQSERCYSVEITVILERVTFESSPGERTEGDIAFLTEQLVHC